MSCGEKPVKIKFMIKEINMQQNDNCRLCSDRDETVIQILSYCSKLAQKEYKSRYDWVGKVIY